METLSVEITEKEYCIKINRDIFGISLVQQLIERIQVEHFFSKNSFMDEGDIISRTNKREEFNAYDHLEDK